MFRASTILVAFAIVSLAGVTNVAAQCQTATLFVGIDNNGALDATDCVVNPFRNSVGEFWTLNAAAGDFFVVTMRRVTMFDPYLIVLDPSDAVVAINDDGGLGDPSARVTFTASTSGLYRVVATTFYRTPSTDFGTYTIRANGVTTPTAPEFTTVNVVGSAVTLAWRASISPTPILEYVLEVGSSSGARNIGTFSVGTSLQLVASASPGVYYIRLRARNALGYGDYSPERVLTVGPELSAPRFLGASVLGRRVTLTWSPPLTPGTEYYEVVVGSAPGLSNVVTLPVGLVTSLSFDNVPVGAYYVRVRGANSRGPGAESNEVVVLVF